MATARAVSGLPQSLPINRGVCFIMLPNSEGARSARCAEVYAKYIEPACKRAGYRPLDSDALFRADMVAGVTNALSCAPMAIAYLGSPPWDASVMLEIGYRLSNNLPLVYLRDKDENGHSEPLPGIVGRNVVCLPAASKKPAKRNDVADRAHQEAKVNEIVAHIESEQETHPETDHKSMSADDSETEITQIVKWLNAVQNDARYLDSVHAIAWINVCNSDTERTQNLIYISASEKAEQIFGVDGRLVGLSMVDFQRGLRRRMPPAQYAAFVNDQLNARRELRVRLNGVGLKTAVATIPIYFERHENPEFNGRAYLPVIFKDFRPQDKEWYSIGVLYLDVTSITTVDPQRNCYTCALNPMSRQLLDPLPHNQPIRVFLSYATEDRDEVEMIAYSIKDLFYPDVEPWMDEQQLVGGRSCIDDINKSLKEADIAFVFYGRGGLGRFQKREVESIEALDCRMVPVILPGGPAPDDPLTLGKKRVELLDRAGVCAGGNDYLDYCDSWLRRIFREHFPGRFPG